MTKIYASSFTKSRFFSKVFLIAAVFISFISFASSAQVTVYASLGDPMRPYTTLRAAFDGINTGVHMGTITIEISGNTTEGASAVLNSSGAGAAAYTSVSIYPVNDGVTVTGTPGAGRGVIELNGADNVTIDGDNPNTGGTNRNLNIINGDATANAAGACIRIATNTNVTSADAITIQNCLLTGNVTGGNNSGITTPASSSGVSYGIYAGGNGGATPTTAPTAISPGSPESAPAAATMNNLLLQNNEINQVARGIHINGSATSVSNSVTATDNLIGPASAGATCVYLKGIVIQGAASAIVNNNTVRNISSYVTTAMAAIELANPIGSGTISINNNTITNINQLGNQGASGILVSSGSAPYTVSGNTITNVSGAGSFASIMGIQINSGLAAPSILNNRVSQINGSNAANWSAVSGIYLKGSANGAKITNNFVWDVKHSYGGFSLSQAATGIGIAAGSNHKIYHNSVNMYTASAGAASTSVSCLGISSNGLTGMDIRNNIFNNSLTAVNVTSVSACIFMPFTYTAAVNHTINNNGYFTNSGVAAVGYAGNTAYNAGNVYATLAAWQAVTQGMGNGSNDVYSINPAGAAPFTSATDLHIPNGTTTALEGGGAPLGVTTDIDGNARSLTIPDIGADEFNGNPVDNVPPTISYVLPSTCALAKTLTATITDVSGVPTAGPTLPILKWRINAGAWTTVVATFGGGSTYTFNFGGGINGDVISYFIVASDSLGNIIASPSAGAGGYVVNPTDAATPPTTPYQYTNLAGLAGIKYIPGDYATLTDAAAAFNTACLSGNLEFVLKSTYSSATETFPITFNNNIYTDGSMASYTLTIRPDAGANPVITGVNGQALLKLNGADRIIIDGSNNGTNSQNLTITNTDINSSATNIWISASSSTDGANYNVIKNCKINSPYNLGSPVVLAGIFSSANAANSNNTIQNNEIKGVVTAIGITGRMPTGFDQNWLITGNKLGSTVVAEMLGLEGIAMEGCANFTISGNEILGIRNISSTTDFLSGILFGNYTGSGQVYNNQIHDIKFNSIWGCNGICLASNNPAAGIQVYNNFIWDIAASGWSGYDIDDNGYGIVVYSGGGYKIYYNSISMNASQSSGYPAAINILPAITQSNALDIRNNIFSNTGTGGTRFGMILQAATSVLQYNDFNDYFATNNVGRSGTTNATTLATWRTLTGKDVSSLAVDPQFINVASNLHLNTATSPLNQMATPIAGITTDIDGNTRDVTKPDIGADEFNGPACAGTPSAGTATVQSPIVCISGDAVMNATGYSLAEGINFQWQWSTDNFGSSINSIAGATSPAGASYTTAGVPVWFRLKATCTNSGLIGYSNIVYVNVSNPQILTTTGGARCGIGTVTLSATSSSNTTIDWYLTPTGGSSIGQGTSFTTPVIGSTTTYYAAAQPNPPTPLPDVAANYIYSTATGTSLDAMSGSTVALSTGIDDGTADTLNIGFTFHFAGADYTKFSVNANGVMKLGNTALGSGYFSNNLGLGTINPKLAPFWDDQTTGSDGGVRYVVTGSAPFRILKIEWKTNRYPGTSSPTSLIYQAWLYESSNIIEYRYGAMTDASTPSSSVGIGTVPTDYQSVTVSTNTSSNSVIENGNSVYPATGRMYQFSPPGPACQSPRVAAVATISSAPAINAPTASVNPMCDGQSTNLSISSASDPNYTYTWMPGSLSGSSVTVSPTTTTEYTVNALYTGGGPFSGCTNQAAITISVTPSPPVLTLDNTSITRCPSDPANIINITGGTGSSGTADIGVSVLNQNSTTTTTSSPGMPPFGAWYTGSRQQILYRASELSALGFVGGTVISGIGFDVVGNSSSVGYTSFVVRMGHTSANTLNTTFINFTTTSTSTSTYAAGQPAAGWTSHVFGTPFTWNGTDNIIIETYFSNCLSCGSGYTCNTTNYGYNAILNNSSAGFAAHSIYYGDGTSCNIDTYPTATGVVNFRPNTRFTYNTVLIPTWTEVPNNGTLTIINPPNNTQVSVIPTVNTTYTATTTNTLGCPRNVSAVVTVSSPTASVSIAASPSGPICAGTSVTFTATPTNGGPAPSYQWLLNGSNVGTNSPTYTNSTLVTGDKVKVIMTSNLTPCTPPPVPSNEITMTVNPVPTCSISGSLSVCASSTGNVYSNTIAPTGGTVAHAWTISGNGTIIGPTNGSSVTVSAGAAGSFTLTDAVTRDGCSPASVCSYTVTVNPNLPVSANITVSPMGTICAGSPVTFTATPTNGGATPGYQWQVNGINVPGEINPTFTTSTLVNLDQVRVILTSSETCTSGNPATSNIITMTITGSAPADVVLTSTSACSGQPVTLTATPTNGGASPTYDFYVNSILVQTGPLSTYSFTPGGAFSAYVILHSSLLCPNPNDKTSPTINVSIDPSPTVSISATCTTLLTGSGQQTTLTANAVPNTGVDYAWVLLPSTPVGTNSATYTTGTAGNYQVTVTITATGCTNTATQLINTSAAPLAAGTYPIPNSGCSGFDKISSAVNYINANGITGSGGVIFDIAPGYSETTPVGGYVLTATGTATNGITFRKAAGVGAVTITSNDAVNFLNDAFFTLLGSDYITIKDLTLVEHGGAHNTVPGTNNVTEWGIALLQGTPAGTNGAQNNTIEGNTITLDQAYSNAFGIYSNANHNKALPANVIAITSADGANSGNKFYGNIINNVNTGIYIHGPVANAYYDQGNDVGGSSGATGNTITAWGGQPIGTTFADVLANSYNAGIVLKNQLNDNCSYNSLTTGTIPNLTVTLRGIYKYFSTSPVGTSVTNINHNTLSLSSTFNYVNAEWNGIRWETSNVLVAGLTANINHNTIGGTFGSINSPGNFSTFNCGIYNLGQPGILNCSNNTINGITQTQPGTTGTFYGIWASGTQAVDKTLDDNIIQNVSWQGNLLTGMQASNYVGVKVRNNNISNLINNGSSTVKGLEVTGSASNPVSTVTNNNLSNLQGNAQVNGVSASGVQVFNFSNNSINGISTTGAVPFITGIQLSSAGATISNNSFTNFTVNSTSPNNASIHGILTTVNSDFIGNEFSNFSSNSIAGNGTTTGLINGLYIASGAAYVTINKNRFFDFAASNSGTGVVINGIYLNAVKSAQITNNFISDFRSPNMEGADVVRGIASTSSTAASNVDIYYNTIYLNSANSASTNFGTSGIFHSSNATATTAAMNLRNNIIVNVSDFRGTGKTVGIRRSAATLNNYSTSSNNNSIFVGVPDANHVTYFDGTTNYITLTDFQTLVGPTRESKSVAVMPYFVNVATTPYDLHLTFANNCSFDGQGDNTGILIPDDFDGDARSIVTPFITDIGADEFNGTGAGLGVWAGVNSNWMDPLNWCGAVPTNSTNVTIPTGKPFYPIITTNQPVVRNMTINAGGTVTINGAGKLGVYGSIVNSGTFNALDGTIEMAGSAAQTIPAGVFQNNDLKNLIVNNASVTIAGTLKLYGKVSFAGSNRTLATGGFLTLRSLVTGTASVGDITNNGANSGNTITGDVTVERFVPAKRAWRYLSMPTQHNLQTIKESWQENMPANSTAPSTPPGYGIHLTNNDVNAVAYGYDQNAGVGPSLKTYVASNNTWAAVPSTVNVPLVSPGKFLPGVGYMTLIRGDRTVNTFGQPATTTTLREKGALVLGTFAGAPAVPAGKFQGIGNPYASAVDFSKTTRTNLQDVYYMWDPQIGTLGAYVTFGPGAPYTPTPSGASYNANNFIESGQAFFVASSGPAGSITFNEPAKVDGSYLVTRQANSHAALLRTNLYSMVENQMHLFDGNLVQFDATFSNGIDNLDAGKMENSGENLGIRVGNKVLSVESHASLSETDTIYFNLSRLRATGYSFAFIPENMDPTFTGYLIDTYLKTSTIVSMIDTTHVNFNVLNDPASYATDRFYLVFRRSTPVPVTFIDVRAGWRDRDIQVSWDVANEEQIQHYEVERSGNGSNFGKVHVEPATGATTYHWLDTHPLAGDNFYRIRAVGVGGDVKYSEIVKVSRDKKGGQISVYPNPVKDDGVLYVDLQNQPAGKYMLQMLNEAGQVVHSQSLNHSGGSSVYSLQLKQMLAHGNYMLKVSNGSDVKLSFKVVF